MAEFPALPIFTDAYLADTRHLTTEEHGAYLLLLMCAWRTRGCTLKDDDRFLARIVGVSGHKWRRLKPVLAEFFMIEDGKWRQKKLLEVYRGVEARVAKNRINGAKGGRAKASKKITECQENATAGSLPTKTRVQIPKPKQQDAKVSAGEEKARHACLTQIAAAAGLKISGMDVSEYACWLSAGADMEMDILPTIKRLHDRETRRNGRAPVSLAYYSAAILDARDKRLNAVTKGVDHASAHPPAPEKRRFDPTSTADWRLFLGDASSRFRGDYLARHWRIGPDHPVFLPFSFGPDPTVRPNPIIPKEIVAEYGPNWAWAMPGKGGGGNFHDQGEQSKTEQSKQQEEI